MPDLDDLKVLEDAAKARGESLEQKEAYVKERREEKQRELEAQKKEAEQVKAEAEKK